MEQSVWEPRLSRLLPTIYEIGTRTFGELMNDVGEFSYKYSPTILPNIMHSMVNRNTQRIYEGSDVMRCVHKGLSWVFVYENKTENWQARLRYKKLDDALLIAPPTTRALRMYVSQDIQYTLGVGPEVANFVIGYTSNWVVTPSWYLVCPNGERSNAWVIPINGEDASGAEPLPAIEAPPQIIPPTKVIPLQKGQK